MAANWDGFKDDQTGIYGYTWSVGNDTCQEDIHQHDDPHAHIYYESEWTHEGVATMLLADGHYHISVRALNKVEFGGPMATTVCHTTLYTIDTTPPFVHEVYDWEYDDETCSLTVGYNVSDPLSYIREVDIGYGLSTRDVYLMDWKRHYTFTNLTHEFCIPDGVVTWVRIKAWNNVDLYETGHAPIPVVVDTSPPAAGDLFDGPLHGIDIEYQSTQHEICANWQDFYDPESGIDKYVWGVGTSPFSDDVSPFQEYHHQAYAACNESVSLEHNTKYFSTLTAYNAGHKILTTTVSSNGVLYDSTPPTKGEILDGLDPINDVEFSSEASSVSANWHGFEDPESDIEEYAVTIWRKRDENSTSWEVLQDTVTLPGDSSSFNWHHFHHKQGDMVYTHIEAMNRARSSTSDSTDGFVIDVSAPIMYFLGDGLVPGENDQFTSSKSTLHANWDFQDPESGVARYELAVYEKYGGSKKKIHPKSSDEWEIVEGKATGWTSPGLNLKTGGQYSIRVSSINYAGLSNVQDTDGVIVDPTAPRMNTVAIGNMAADMEELFEGFVQQTDEFGITAYWYAIDYESGIKTYFVSVGTSPGKSDVCERRDMGSSAGGYIDGLHLELYDDEKDGPIYYLTVVAQNGANSLSEEMVSSPIKIVPGDQVGIVIDGSEPAMSENGTLIGDVDYQKEATVVSAHFHGFESYMHGIVHYEWAVGTTPRGDDVQPFIRAGIVVGSEENNPGGGIAGFGKCQSLLYLENGVTYYITVRAITGAGNALESVADGFTVDIVKPDINIVTIGVAMEENVTCSKMIDVCYQDSSDSITAEWAINEPESDIVFSEFCFGSYPGASDVYNCTDTSESLNIPNAMVSPADMGQSNILFLRTLNEAGLWGQTVSGSIIVDTTPATAGFVKCPLYVDDTEIISCTWSEFHDSESDVVGYRFGIGTEEGDDSLYPFIDLAAHYRDFTAKNFETHLNHSSTLYVTVIAVNGVGYESSAYSEKITVDLTPPIPGRVIELDGVHRLNLTAGASGYAIGCETDEECDKHDAVCQKSLTSVTISWQPFQDPESSMKRYQVALGTSPGGTQLLDFRDVDDGQMTVHVGALDLTTVRVVYAMVRGFNQVGLSATASSNGVFISRVSSGLSPLGEIYVWDGDIFDGDIDYQDDTNEISGQWNFNGDPCPIVKYKWSIMRFDGAEMQPMTDIPSGRTSATTDGLGMSDGESYYIVVKATNALGYSYSLRSDGVNIMMEPLLPGIVRDGDIVGLDLNYQASVVTLSANWDGFGQDNGYGGPGATPESQQVHHYEVAAGTDRRYPSTRNDIHPFVDVGLNNTHTFYGLRLVPQSVTYYLTVRAYAVSTTMTESTSNGVKVGYGGEVLSPGEVTVDRYISSTTNVTASWTGFEFGFPILFYQWGMMSAGTELGGISCSDLRDAGNAAHGYFDVYPLTYVRDDTMVVQSGLKLEHNHEYIVVVVANDESATCAVANSSITVDITPPEEGEFVIGPLYDERVAYVPRLDSFTVEWRDFKDDESGISHFSIALFDGVSCQGSGQQVMLRDFEDVPPSINDFTFNEVELKVDRPYFVQLKAINNAGLTTTATSMPILVDPYDPDIGIVKDGLNFVQDVEYQADNSTMEGVFIHQPLHEGEVCPGLVYDFEEGRHPAWHHIHTKGVWGLEREHRILFDERQLHFHGNALSIEMLRDVQSEQMLSAAYYTPEPEVSVGGTYEFEIRAASSKLEAVTSVVFWDGPEGVVGDFGAILYDLNSGEGECTCCHDIDRDTSGCLDLCDCSNIETTTEIPDDNPPPVIIEDELEGDTGGHDRTSASSAYRSIGIQLTPGVEYNGTVRSFVTLWGRHENDRLVPVYAMKELDFDPDDEVHRYVVNVLPDKEQLLVELSVDGKPIFELHGCPILSVNTSLTLAVWNRDDYVAPYEDVFNPPSSEARFAVVRMPPHREELCRYGNAFRNGIAPIVTFYAAIASYTDYENITPFAEVERPCITCSSSCSIYNCDPRCPSPATSEYQVKVDGLNLSEWVITNGTETAASYFVKVVAFTGK
ncbi:uncharacterized protein [Ptychodera flava]|uniref:uncharacterized protein n=1 Tax=Ptychodera flava TaxID=63121 RepID=UPI00396A9C8F